MTDTPARQPHPQRCETCENRDCDFYRMLKGNAIDFKLTLQLSGIGIADAIYDFVKMYGCATHTSPPAHRLAECDICTAAKNEREKVESLFVSGRNSNGMGALYARPDEPSYIEGVIIGKKYYRLNGSICGTITAKEMPIPDYYNDDLRAQQEQP